MKMNKKQLIATIASNSDMTQNDVTKVLKSLTDICLSELKTNKMFILNDLVRMKVVEKPAQPERQMKSPATGQMMTVAAKPASKKLRVAAAKPLRDLVKS